MRVCARALTPRTGRQSRRQGCATNLASVLEMRDAVQSRAHKALSSIIANHVYVGCVDDRFSLLQSGTRLYVVDMPAFTREAFYQAAVFGFAAFSPINLSPPFPARHLLRCVLDAPEAGWRPEDGSKDEVADFAAKLLQQHSAMLAEYFQIRFDAEGNVTALPQLIPGYVPAMQLLPMFLLRLTTEVDWSAEAPCLNGICREVAAFYCLRPGVAALHSQHPMHPDNVQALTSGAGGSAAAGDVAMSAAEAAVVAAMEEEERRACCRGTCGPRLEKGDMLDAGVEAGVDAALAAVVEGSVDPLVADARERRKRLHWCASPPSRRSVCV
jgi:hypothetical protein